MSVHTSTLVLYKNAGLEFDRNFLVDSLADYLTTLTKETISSFQYQKHALSLNIKIDKTQASLDYISDNNFNYCSIKNDDGRLVYYYVIGKQWKAQSTIELNLRMDAINTFALGTDYTLSKQSLVMREHKDRVIYKSGLYFNYSEKGIGGFIGYQDTWDATITIPNADAITDCNISSYSFYLDDGSPWEGINPTIYNTTITGNTIRVDVDFHGSFPVGHMFYMNISLIITYKGYIKKIDKFPEGINPVLYKGEKGQLYDGDEGANWYLIYKNANAVVSDSDATEAKYVNPVKLLITRDSPFSKIASTTDTYRLYASDIIKIPDKRENVVFRYKDIPAGLTGTAITIDGTAYSLVDWANCDRSTRKAGAIVFTRINNTDVIGSVRIYYSKGLFADFDTIPNISYIDIYKYARFAYVEKGIFSVTGLTSDSFSYTQQLYGYVDSDVDTSKTIGEIDLTDSQLIKVIELPYAPIAELVGIDEISILPANCVWNSGEHMIEVADTTKFSFNYFKTFELNPLDEMYFRTGDIVKTTGQSRRKAMETKLMNSEFHYSKFVYGRTTYQFRYELIDLSSDFSQFIVEYGVSQSVQSKFLFKFSTYVTTGYDTQDYNDVLLCDINNEKAIYNNSYINYLRSGQYAHDVQAKNNANMMNWLAVGIRAIGVVTSFATAPITGGLSVVGGVGLGTSTFEQVASAVNSANKAERDLEMKKNALTSQSESVSMVDDLDLFEIYTEGKPKIVEYHPSEIVEGRIYDLFFYCGYATSEYKIPSFTGRKYFNFIQARIKYASDHNLPEDIKEEIKNKYEEGITCLHKVSGSWDFSQSYENYETSLE